MEKDLYLHDAIRANVFHHLVNDGQGDLGIPAKRNNGDGGRVDVVRELPIWKQGSNPTSAEGTCRTLEKIPCPGMIDQLDERSGLFIKKRQ